ncbi:MAG: peptidoglycan D,D-transpeptidase FtsI family protein [Planctomycetota bacterium]
MTGPIDESSNDAPDGVSMRADDTTTSARLMCHRTTAWAAMLSTVCLVGLALLLARVVQLKIIPDAQLAAAAGSSTSQRTELQCRGRLLDRRGRIIAASTLGHRLFIDPQAVQDRYTIAVDVARLIDGDPIEMDRKLSSRPDSRYVVVDELLESWQVDAIRASGLAGVGLDPRLVRHYPHAPVGRQIIGIVGRDHIGLNGMECLFEDELRQRDGRLTYLRDARRRPMWVSPEDYQPGVQGEDVRLSLDIVVQDAAERHLQAAVERYNAGGGRLVVLDCRSGELLAMADVLRTRPGWEEQTVDPVRDIDPGLARNRCITDPYEPGSTFKPFIWAAATHLGRVDMQEQLPTPPKYAYRTSRGRVIRDSHYIENADWLTVLLHSINSGMAIVAERMSHAEMQQAISDFAFGHRTNCDLPGESPGIVTTPRQWSHYTQTSVCMGHEIAVTPLQMVRAFAVFARDGSMPLLRISAAVDERDQYQFVRQVIPEWLAGTVRDAMRQVMERGSGHRARSDRYQLFGKSGTAQLPKKEGGGYHENRYVSSFIAGAPFENPRLVVLCVIDDPDRSRGHFGGAIAGPVVRDVMDEVLTYLGEPADVPEANTNAVALTSRE